MRESRLFRIVYYLLEHGKVTAPELAQKMEVSVRTVYRDIDSIKAEEFLCLIIIHWKNPCSPCKSVSRY